MKRRIRFELSMPNRGSWDGKWSGSERRYVVERRLTDEQAASVLSKDYYHYSWPDGWSAGVAVREFAKGEKLGKSDGFNGYDWMVSRIISHGRILADHQLPERVSP